MIFCTSISRSHRNGEQIQKDCINSWMQFGFVYSFNTKEEIEHLKGGYPGVEFVETHRTVKELFGKNLIQINAFIDFAKDMGEDLVIVNSDIFIDYLPVFKTDGVTMLTRNDYRDDIKQSKAFIHGFDLYFIPNAYLKIYPPVIYGLGNCWWDFSLAYRAIKKNIPVYWPQGRFIFHKEHEVQYDYVEWLKTAEFYKWEFGVDKNVTGPQLANSMIMTIKLKAIK